MSPKLRRRLEDLLCVLALAFVMAVMDARAEDLSKPVMLVASPSLGGAYRGTVVLAVPREGVHLGFILNRATDKRLAALFPDHAPSAKVTDHVYFGGPELSDAVFAVVERNPGGEAWHLFGKYYVASTVETIDRIIEETPNDARYFAGLVGWMPDELAKEVAAGFWYVTDPDPAMLRGDPSGAWESLVNKLGNGHDRPRNLISASLDGDRS